MFCISNDSGSETQIGARSLKKENLIFVENLIFPHAARGFGAYAYITKARS